MELLHGREAGRPLAAHHLLLLPEGTRERAVGELVFAHHPDAATHAGRGLPLGRHAALLGPLVLDAGAAAAAAVPAPWRLVWALDCPVERDGPPLPWLRDRDGLSRAFPDGLPVRAERRAVDLLLGVARRLGGAVRVAPSGVLLVPDPEAWPDVVVITRRALPPEHLAAALVGVCPGIAPAGGAEQWAGVRPEAMSALAGVDTGLHPAVRDELHAALDRRDAAAAAAQDAPDGYALAVALTSGASDGGVVEVLVGPVEDVPPLLAGWGARACHRVRWWPPDEAAAEQEHPPAVHVAQRRAAIAVIHAIVGALVAQLEGVAVDAGGFPLSARAWG